MDRIVCFLSIDGLIFLLGDALFCYIFEIDDVLSNSSLGGSSDSDQIRS